MMALALMLAEQDGAGAQTASRRRWHDGIAVRSPRDPIENLGRGAGLFAECFRLQSIGENPQQDVLGQVRCRSAPEHRSPRLTKTVEVETAKARDLNLDVFTLVA
jgi:hypothetical protein